MSKRGRKAKIVSDLDKLVAHGARSIEPGNELRKSVSTSMWPGLVDTPAASSPSKRPRKASHMVDDTCTDVLERFITELGLHVFLGIYQACMFVPHSLLHYRKELIVNIVNAGDFNIAREKIIEFIDATIATRSTYHVGHPPSEVLWKATHTTGMSHLKFLTPPTVTCLKCHSHLSSNNKPSQIILYTQLGPLPTTKIILRCKRCNINYHPDIFGNSAVGYEYYQQVQPFVRCTQEAYMERCLHSMIVSAGHHAWTSFESWAEIYNEVHQDAISTKQAKQFFSQNLIATLPVDNDESDDHVACWAGHLTRKHVSEAFWNGEVENELRDNNDDFRFTAKSDREAFMDVVDHRRAGNPYPHNNCHEECRKRGCGTLWSIDGNWKLTYPICMYEEPKHIFTGNLHYTSSCPRQPVPKMAFCEEHCEIALKQDIPIELRAYVKYRKELKISDSEESSNSQRNTPSSDSITAADCQGISGMINKHPEFPLVIDYTDEDEGSQTTCNKDTGTQKKVQKWTRGHLFIVRGGGHIETWQPLYQSEGPAQVFLIVLTWLTSVFAHLSREEVKTKVLSYDNMCHLNNLKVAKKPLPLPSHLQNLWLDVQKIIDSLHISNHKDTRCKELYSPDKFKSLYPDSNTMCCEQTFTWLSRYKRILCAMPKTHHHFYIHRMIKHRNKYIEMCYKEGRRPVLPNIKKAT